MQVKETIDNYGLGSSFTDGIAFEEVMKERNRVSVLST